MSSGTFHLSRLKQERTRQITVTFNLKRLAERILERIHRGYSFHRLSPCQRLVPATITSRLLKLSHTSIYGSGTPGFNECDQVSSAALVAKKDRRCRSGDFLTGYFSGSVDQAGIGSTG